MPSRTLIAEERAHVLSNICMLLGQVTPLEELAQQMDRADTRPTTAQQPTELKCLRRMVPAETLKLLTEVLEPAMAYQPDLTLLSDDQAVYMHRWWLKRKLSAHGNGGEHGLYLHAFWNDDPAGLHNHPWPSASLLLSGQVRDHTNGGRWTDVCAGDVVLRPADYQHRLTLDTDTAQNGPHAISLIATGSRRPEGWKITHTDGSLEHIPIGNTDGQPETFSRGRRPPRPPAAS